MLTEDYAGVCPKCSYNRMWRRWGSEGWFRFDACPKCGFAYGTYFDDEMKEVKDAEIWKKIEEHENKTRQEIFEMTKKWKEPQREKFDTVFVYDDIKKEV